MNQSGSQQGKKKEDLRKFYKGTNYRGLSRAEETDNRCESTRNNCGEIL